AGISDGSGRQSSANEILPQWQRPEINITFPQYWCTRDLILSAFVLRCQLLQGNHAASFDHLVGTGEQRRWHNEAECFCRFEIDGQLVLSRRLNRHIGWLLALEDAIDISGRAPVLVDQVGAVGKQATIRDEEICEVD